MLEAAITGGLLSGIVVGRWNAITTVSHVLFANETIIFCDNVCEQVLNLRGILIWFEAVSGLGLIYRRVLYYQLGK